MSCFDRRSVLALLAALPLAACGFTPVYGPGGAGNRLRGRVEIEVPGNQLAFSLVSRLEDRLGRAGSAPFLLSYEIRTSDSALAITEADEINRINITGTAAFAVTEAATGRVVQSGEVTTFTAYATSAAPIATTAARRDAQDRLMIALADQIVARLLAGADDWA
jgi:LPS-assembly lipoprotein